MSQNLEKIDEPSFYNDLMGTRIKAFDLLIEGVQDRKSFFHTPTVTTSDVQARTVVLRGFEPETQTLRFHTDYRSSKIKAIQEDQRGMMVFYDRDEKIQLRCSVIFSIHHQDSIAKEAWDKTSLPSRRCYLGDKAPGCESDVPSSGVPEKNPSLEDSEKGWQNFTVIKAQMMQMEWLYLAAKGHRRAVFKWEYDHDSSTITPEGCWLTP